MSKQALGFDPVAIVAAAKAALERGPELDDVPTLALAHRRAHMVLAERLAPYVALWRDLPADVSPDDLVEAFRLASDLSAARAHLFGLTHVRYADQAQRDAAREKVIADEAELLAIQARRLHGSREHDSADLRARAAALVLEREADAQRIAAAEVASLQSQLDDALRLTYAAARGNGR